MLQVIETLLPLSHSSSYFGTIVQSLFCIDMAYKCYYLHKVSYPEVDRQSIITNILLTILMLILFFVGDQSVIVATKLYTQLPFAYTLFFFHFNRQSN